MTADVAGRPVVRADQVTLGVLVSEVPRDAVDDAVAVCGVREQRSDGKLPAHVTAYLTLGLVLFPDDDYTEVAAKVTGSLDRFGCWNAGWSVPTSSAITQARKRLGRKLFAELFENTCGPVAGRAGPTAAMSALGTARGSFLRGWRLLAIDGFETDRPARRAGAARRHLPHRVDQTDDPRDPARAAAGRRPRRRGPGRHHHRPGRLRPARPTRGAPREGGRVRRARPHG